MGESDTETDVEPAAPGVEVEFDRADRGDDYALHDDGYDVPEWEEIASAGKKVDATPCAPIFDTGERLAKDLAQKGMRCRKDIMSALKLANLKTRVNYRTVEVSGQATLKKPDTWELGLCKRGVVVRITSDTKRRPWLARLIAAMIRAERPGVEFSAFSISQNLEIGTRRDVTPLKGSPSDLNAVVVG